MGIQVQGLNALVRNLQSLGLEVDDLKDAFGPIAARAAGIASQNAPKRSGKLKASVRGNRAKNKAVVTAGKKRVPYAGPINYGWPARNIASSGFMQKADAEMKPLAEKMLEKAISDSIRRRGLR